MNHRFRHGYEIIYLKWDEDFYMQSPWRIMGGPRETCESELSDAWLDAFEEPGKQEPTYPYQTRDIRLTRLFGA